uniref:Lateral signaling target protein 2 homolog n=1 Tax=Corethrella appendiculata TaxID=1370023 RepID=W4VR85_9DIPT
MEGSGDGSPQSSCCMIRAAELFPKPVIEKEDDKLIVPFAELAGESVKYLGQTDDGVLALSNYRLFVLKNSTLSETSVPLGLIENAITRDLFHLIISCKDASSVKCSFSTSEQCSEWQRRITLSVGVPENLETLFAFPFHAWASESPAIINSQQDNEWSGRLCRAGNSDDDFLKEVERLQFDLQGAWRISHVNAEFKLCSSYPKTLLVPACISDETLQNVASFRSSRRIPAVVWRHQKSGAVIARCSQPEVGWLGWRNSKDEQLLKALSDACSFDKGGGCTGTQSSISSTTVSRTRNDSTTSNDSTTPSPEGSHEEVNMDEPKKILIVDARSYTSAVTNRARGGGCECAEYYPSAEIQFMNLGNIHVIRKSFHALRQLCASQPDIPNWLRLLEQTMWLQHLSGLLASSVVVVHAIERNGRPVLVHCSDGWDRTPQIVATAQLCLDPYYRTVEGFRILVEREWLSFGHKFADRCGHGPGSDELNERCPVFLQWLDCVHQIHRQFPCSFEFSMGYLIKLAQHSHSCLFGTFLCNTYKERQENSINDRTFSVWAFLSGPIYKNPLYVPNHRERVLWPAHNVRDLALWSEVYLGSLGGNQYTTDYPTTDGNSNNAEISSMTKTRSYGDLVTGIERGLTRRSSDPNMSVETNILSSLNLSQENSIDSNISSDREISPDLIDRTIATIQDTTQKLQNLTQELNQSDEELEQNLQKKSTIKQQLQEQHEIYMNQFVNNDDISSPFFNSTSAATIVQQQQQPQEHSLTSLNNHNLLNDLNETINLNDESTTLLNNFKNSIDEIDSGVNCEQEHSNEIIHEDNFTTTNRNSIADMNDSMMMQSVDLNDKTAPSSPTSTNYLTSNNNNNLWHGSIETSTDTLVPIDQYNNTTINSNNSNNIDIDDKDCCLNNNNNNINNNSNCLNYESKEDFSRFNNSNSDNNGCDLYDSSDSDKEKSNRNCNNFNSRSNDSRTMKNNLPDVHRISNNNYNNNTTNNLIDSSSINHNNNINNNNNSIMDESIIIQPQYQHLEISSIKNYSNNNNNNQNLSSVNVQNQHHQQQQRRRRNSSNSKGDLNLNKIPNGSVSPSATNSRFSTPGARSLPLTPPGVPFVIDRPPVALSCPDGLAHALSEQNLRLQQIVYEHKLREEALQKELYATRLALLKKTCHHCNNNQQYGNDEPVSMVDSMIENASVCSWEAVDDQRSGPSSGANSAQQLQQQQQQQFTSSVLWVPDHAVSKCTNCQTEFWLGRRKHHCRSCGQIFCADCSEFWAPLPDEKLFQPVRLCAPCYQTVNGKMQQHQQQNQQISFNILSNNTNITTNDNCNIILTSNCKQPQLQLQPQQLINCKTSSSSSAISSNIISTTSAAATIEPSCKHSVECSTVNGRSAYTKATTATN